MGFGLLFIGYFITFVMTLNNFGFIFGLAGYLVMALALLRLCRFERRFYPALICSLLLILVGAYYFLCEGAGRLNIELQAWVLAAKPAAEVTIFITEAALNIALLRAIANLAGGLELTRQCRSAWRNMVLVGVYFIIDTTRMLFFLDNQAAGRYLIPITLLLRLGWTALNLVLIFSCYMRICPEGEEDMPEKKSGLESIRRFLEGAGRTRKETREKPDGENTQGVPAGKKTKRERGHRK